MCVNWSAPSWIDTHEAQVFHPYFKQKSTLKTEFTLCSLSDYLWLELMWIQLLSWVSTSWYSKPLFSDIQLYLKTWKTNQAFFCAEIRLLMYCAVVWATEKWTAMSFTQQTLSHFKVLIVYIKQVCWATFVQLITLAQWNVDRPTGIENKVWHLNIAGRVIQQKVQLLLWMWPVLTLGTIFSTLQ